jgi:hypothetical protein
MNQKISKKNIKLRIIKSDKDKTMVINKNNFQAKFLKTFHINSPFNLILYKTKKYQN